MQAAKRPRDFEPKQHKLGKAKPGAVNLTNTNFTAKKICIKEQALTIADKIGPYASEPVNSEAIKGEDYDYISKIIYPILARCSRNNCAKVKKDGFSTLWKRLKEIFGDTSDPSASAQNKSHRPPLSLSKMPLEPVIIVDLKQKLNLLMPYLSAIMDVLAPGMIVQDYGVRSMAYVCTRWLFMICGSQLPTCLLGIWIRFLHLALCHIDDQVRQDAIRNVQMALEFQPNLMIEKADELLSILLLAKTSLNPSKLSSIKPNTCKESGKAKGTVEYLLFQVLKLLVASSKLIHGPRPFQIAWSTTQTSPLHIWKRQGSKQQSIPKLPHISEDLLLQVTSHICTLPVVIDHWADMCRLLKVNYASPSKSTLPFIFATTTEHETRLAIQKISEYLLTLIEAYELSGFAESKFWTSLPPFLLNSLEILKNPSNQATQSQSQLFQRYKKTLHRLFRHQTRTTNRQ